MKQCLRNLSTLRGFSARVCKGSIHAFPGGPAGSLVRVVSDGPVWDAPTGNQEFSHGKAWPKAVSPIVSNDPQNANVERSSRGWNYVKRL
jgi:hypothetical protein